ncbi:MAG: hypothetical protein KF760_07590 [Candidatus Eremiobacteraeota bacterium]|nr:hypothetical protein [Candidatus Eremiobacteraeota bacterium]MCW5871528.1 hypothetical protein [Candidatus Eremiobacteraeota bacterium]
MFRKLWLGLLFPLLALAAPGGHSHNDYEQEKPFELAVRCGMLSLEADVFPSEGRLLVAHSRADLDPDNTLRELYLEPLQRWQGRPLELLIDIKAEPDLALTLLEQELTANPPPKQTVVILSGLRPKRVSRLPYLTLEGSVAELRAQTLPAHCRYVSGPWWPESSWRGEGPMPSGTRARLQDLVKQVHEKGLLLRLWGTPDEPEAWAEFYRAGVDRINTDHPRELADFLKERESR